MMFFVFVLGLVVGSFLNVVIDRVPEGEDVVWKPSHCDHCRRALRWYELIPLISYVVLRGRCLRCHKPLSIQYPLVELVTAIGFIFIYVRSFSSLPHLLSYLFVYCCFLVLWVIDWKRMILPDIFLVLILFFAFMLLTPLSSYDRYIHVFAGILSAFGFFLLWAITRGKGLGFGDVKLVGILGLLLGYPYIIIALYVAFLTGAFYGVILMVGRKAGMKSKIAFGPFLIFGAAISSIWGELIWKTWQSII